MPKKIMFLPGLAFEDFLLNRDLSYELRKRGFETIIFEENLKYAQENMDMFEETFLQQKPDFIIGYNNQVFSLNKELGVVSTSIFEVYEVPYCSLVFGLPFSFLNWYLSSFKMAKNLRKVSFYCNTYEEIGKAFGIKDCMTFPFSIGYLKPTKYNPSPNNGSCLLWQDIGELPQINGVYSASLASIFYQALDMMDKISFGELHNMLPLHLRSTVLESKFMDDLDSYSYKRLRDKLKLHLDNNKVKYKDVILGFPTFKDLSAAVQSVDLVLHLPGIFNNLGWDSISWLVWRAGGVSLLPKTGLWKDVELAVDWRDEKHLEFVIETLRNNPSERDRYKEEIWGIINKNLLIENTIEQLIPVLDY